jgi:hypothetical protein
MVVPPPGLLSMMTVWPSFSCNGPEITRAAASEAPPGGKVTMIFTPWAGHCWAAAPRAPVFNTASAAVDARTVLRAIMRFPP